MSNDCLKRLAEAYQSELAKEAAEGYYTVASALRDEFRTAVTPSVVLALLAERDAQADETLQLHIRLTAMKDERDALQAYIDAQVAEQEELEYQYREQRRIEERQAEEERWRVDNRG